MGYCMNYTTGMHHSMLLEAGAERARLSAARLRLRLSKTEYRFGPTVS